MTSASERGVIKNLSPEEFRYISDLVFQRTGVQLGEGKEYLVEGRLTPVLDRFRIQSYSDLLRMLQVETNPCVSTAVLDAMMTNESLFFRDQVPFECLVELIIPELGKKSRAPEKLRIWSSACSTGQEPYSIVMAIQEGVANLPLGFEVLATDICSCALEKARKGCYSDFEVHRGLSPERLARNFERDKDQWRIKGSVFSHVTFQRCNLLDPSRVLDRFDVIFCRNVLIYFNDETKIQVLNGLIERLKPGGYLVLGGTESALGNQFAALECVRFKGMPVFMRKE